MELRPVSMNGGPYFEFSEEHNIKEKNVSMKNRKLTPHRFRESKAAGRQRVGVPGGELYPYDGSVLLRYAGTGVREALVSYLFWGHMAILFSLASLFYICGDHSGLRAATVPQSFTTALSNLSNFVLTFFIGQTFSKCNVRFDNVCKTNGNVTRMSAVAAGTLPKKDAEKVIRYTNSILHIYYLLNSGGGMTDAKWELLMDRGLLTTDEVDGLKQQGSPGPVLYSWAVDVIRSAFTNDPKASTYDAHLMASIEECIGGTRGLGAKQIAYSLTQIPFIYFQNVFFVVNANLVWSHYVFAHDWAEALWTDCDGTSPGACYPKAFIAFWCQFSLTVVFLSLLLTAAHLAECYGDKQYHYDLGFDLDNLWTESKSVLKSMDHRKKTQ
jgi:hypothetical protein